MNVGMRVRGGLFAALIVCAMPVAATLAGMLVASSAAAQSVGAHQQVAQRDVGVARDVRDLAFGGHRPVGDDVQRRVVERRLPVRAPVGVAMPQITVQGQSSMVIL